MPRCFCWLAVLVVAFPAAAQQSAVRDAGPALATREELEESLVRLARQGRSPEAALIRTRLDSGDFQPGDRILIRVEGEAALSDTFTVRPGPTLPLPQLGAVSLAGVLRSELPGRLETHLAHYLRDPTVQVRPLIRILVEGEVAKPGFYAVPPELPLADAISSAGGLTQRAKPTAIRVERGSNAIWSGDPLQQALGRGLTLDQLSLRAGDRVFVPARGDFARTIGIIGGLLAIPVSIYIITRNRQ
jgi:protein involved in polysaccharide export with SLBB domain